MKLKVLGVNAGNGVMVHPFKRYLKGNIECRGDYKTPKDIQWKLNFEDIPLYNGKGLYPEKCGINIIIGHPNCGHSSLLAYSRGKKLGDGKSDVTMVTFVASIKYHKPLVFLFENLTSLFKSFPENEFDKSFDDYDLIKYNVSVSAFGNSQISRHRLVVVGIRKDQQVFKSKYFKLPPEDFFKLQKVKELEANLKFPDKELCHLRESDNTIVCMEKDFKKLNLKQIRDIWNSKEYRYKKKWDATTTGKGNMKNLPGVYRNLPDEFPLTARKQNRQFNSQGYIMSPRELARMQNIPDDFKLWYDQAKDQYCINKARVTATKCPPYDIGLWFYKCIIKAKKRYEKGKANRL